MATFYENLTAVEDFVAGPSGVGYSIPDKYHGSGGDSLAAFAALTAEFMAKADLRIVNAITDGECAPDCVSPFLGYDNIDAVFEYFGSAYCGRQGGITWINNKPVIGGRFGLWGSEPAYNDPTQLARKLRALPKDPTNPNAYSLVPVHVWTHTVKDVIAAVNLLGSDYFNVVTPTQLVQLVQQNVFHNCSSAGKAQGPWGGSCHGGVDECGALKQVQCDTGKGYSVFNDYFDHTVCPDGMVSNCFGVLVCGNSTCDCAGPPSGSFSSTCKCQAYCGVLSDCVCEGEVPTQKMFDYSVCPGFAVANCQGALVCQGQPCA